MLEIIVDTWAFWSSVVLTIWLVSAYTRAELFRFEFTYQAMLHSNQVQITPGQIYLRLTCRPMTIFYRPKIPNSFDQNDDEDSPFIYSR
ncbi:hypothetical protein [Alkalihalobacillus pseudalcaliphilus]|uniref:hypothetical protein n=1 Tax=Alkalihalobacillus pseudalcaliphilus TaxID=79884 RepID=UPI00064D8BA7|nr:hypothetical protein [Alkalihalobacillus pseudalcaliphilus]KMK75674.1 hypothetical protein AB990_10340 [Alkalihalobacillus pseudalcaliphilus]